MPEDDKGKLVLLLNWIAFCLVQDPTGQSIASALHLDTPMTITFLLASKLSPSPKQLAYADRLFASLQSIVSRQVAREMDGLAPLSPEEDIPEFLGVVARDAYKRAHRKAKNLDYLGPKYNLGSTQAFVRKLLGDEGVSHEYALVDNAYTGILTQTPLLLSKNVKTRVTALLAITQHAQAILESTFVVIIRGGKKSDGSERHPYTSDPDTSFRYHFYRRLERLSFYRFGAYRAFGEGGNTLRRLSTAGWTIKHEWIPTPPPFIFRFPQDSASMLRDVFREQYNHTASVENIRHALSVVRKSGTNEVWRKGDERVLYVHPEVQIFGHLRDKQIMARRRAIGCSKRPCHWSNVVFYEPPPTGMGTGLLRKSNQWKYTMSRKKNCLDWIYLGNLEISKDLASCAMEGNYYNLLQSLLRVLPGIPKHVLQRHAAM